MGGKRNFQRNLGLSFTKADHDYCRIPAKKTKCSDRLGISEQPGPKKLEARSSIVQNYDTTDGKIASGINHHVPMYYSWKRDPGRKGIDAMQQNLENLFGYAFPRFCMI